MATKPTRITGELDEKTVGALGPGMHRDGITVAGTTGLYLQCASGAHGKVRRSWIFRFTATSGKERQIGLGSLAKVSVQDARLKAREYRTLRDSGVDPIGRREQIRSQRAQQQNAKIAGITFDQCAAKYIEAHRDDWRSAKHAYQWEATLRTYVSPVFGPLPVSAIERPHVIEALEPIWNAKRETARRVRGRIEAVLAWAAVSGYRGDDNPARWKGLLDQRFSRKRTVKHHAALPYADMGAFMTDLRGRDSVAARALEFTILTAVRTSEALGAQWREIDATANVWTIPGPRMKAGREYRVPLSDVATAVLKRMETIRSGEHVFPSPTDRCPTLSNMAMSAVLRRMGRGDLTVHGFRSTFRDWAAEQTNFPNHVVEMALAHAVGDEVEAAYRRGDLFDKRRKLMDAWAAYCTKTSHGNVVPIAAERLSAKAL